MTVLLALLALTAWAVPATIVAIARDGYGQAPTKPDYESSRSA
ncbi:MAG: hypothetical protein ABIP33_03790 [Pseudolysinimonas sp.]